MKNRFISVRIASFLLAAMLLGSSVTVYADETVEDAEVTENVDAENSEAAEEGAEVADATEDAQTEDGALVMSSVTASNGKIIAESFPESIIPEGFHKTTVQYSGTNVEVAYMNSDYYGEVVLAYLANADGSDGDFYLCDINTAEMSDFVKITNGEGKFIVVLDPGDNVVAPAGFIKATLNWHGKNVTAWALPKENVEEEDDKAAAYEPLEVYALDNITAGASNSEEAVEAEAPQANEEASDTEEDENSNTTDSSSTAEDGSRVEYAPASDFFLIYAIDQDGVVGFYLYDITGETFQRYVEIANGDMSLLEQYKSAAKLRLIIIVALAVLLVVAIVIIVNLALKSGNSKPSKRRYSRYDDEEDEEDEEEDDDEDEEIEQMRRRVAKKERRHIKQGRRELNYLMDIEDDEDDEDEEEEEEIARPRRATRTQSRRKPERVSLEKAPARRRMIEEDEDDEDDEEEEVFEAPIRRKSTRPAAPSYEEQQPIRRQQNTIPRGGISIEPDDDMDDDFEFEFLDLK